ncbi:phosphatidylcholine transfer protein isoform X4 [Equus caballus]|uniref:phosphatidylcholine transfer protein isoform X4 n=1 Tax=Equus caballus TaxID=9796 RepID=UPI0038B30F40
MARAAGGFREEQFWEACAELKQPKLAGANWELLMEDTRVYKYKVFGTLKNCPPALLTDVYMDLDYRKQWDQHVEVFMYYFDNLRVQIPTWLLKRALKNGVPEFLNNLEKACRNYPRRY